METQTAAPARRAVLFDCDGVLVDSEPALARIAALSLADFGAPAVPEDFRPYIGTGEDTYLGKVAAKYGVTFNDVIKNHVYAKYVDLAPTYVTAFTGVKELLTELKAAAFGLAVASSADKVKVRANLSVLDLPADFFDAVVTGSDILRKKPFPDIYLLAAERCGVAPAACYVVEDAVSGVQAAKAAGIICIGFTSTHTAAELRQAGADYVITDIRDVGKIVLG